jgi:hypothetical protein
MFIQRLPFLVNHEINDRNVNLANRITRELRNRRPGSPAYIVAHHRQRKSGDVAHPDLDFDGDVAGLSSDSHSVYRFAWTVGGRSRGTVRVDVENCGNIFDGYDNRTRKRYRINRS